MTPMPADVAAWIRDVVLPAGYRDNTSRTDICPCQGSASGHCQTGTHDQCPRTWGWHRHGQPDPDTYITDRRGHVAHARGISAAVWRSGTPCRWVCPCTCHTTVATLFAAPTRQAPRQLATTGYGRISSTDRLRANDLPQPSLFDANT